MSKEISENKAFEDITRKALDKVAKGEWTLDDVLSKFAGAKIVQEAYKAKVPAVPTITDKQREAIEKLVEVFGSVTPVAGTHQLMDAELEALAEEREVIDTVLNLLDKRKKESIRETISNHFDAVAEVDGSAKNADQDKKGHYLVAQEAPAGEGKRWVRQVSNPGLVISSEKLLDLYEQKKISRAQYLSITRENRVFSSDKFVKAAAKDPNLLFLVAEATETKKAPSTAIYLKDA